MEDEIIKERLKENKYALSCDLDDLSDIVEYLQDKVEKQSEILKELAYTVLADFLHMSEYHINSTIVKLAKKAELICNMDIKIRADNDVIDEHWNLED